MITIERYSKAWEQEAKGLRVSADQEVFTVSSVVETVSVLSSQEHPFLILMDGKPVGFFLLDLAYSSTVDFAADDTIGIRALLIDERYQGQGIAKQAICSLPAFVQRTYPHCNRLQLTVNCRNEAAYRCYLKCGFEDTGECYLGGPAGPQHIMQREL
ncbi:GNAT family N-acetyltransferase [Enterovibrio coralii]|uniref:N-acetyltransferase domain-containing protein n=1 Tax=Enterovibrio coralii TaxID=294935 RepID=A0A135IAB9_9GAMM|nr:GNAT family N-acetyltransferase [Enterovibrio coralii]KXF82382.1 hypothetical protein ATN88_09605 [Enterovibrio coralii]